MRRLSLLIVAFVLVAGGCMGDDDNEEAGYEASALERMVLLGEDLEGPWTRFDWGRQGSADQPSGARSQPGRFGRQDGWKARYRRQGTKQTSGPLVIESRADVFDSSEGATDDFDAYGSELETAGTQIEEVPDLGDRAVVATLAQGDVRFFLVMWRDSNAVASINVNGFEGKLTREHALELARKQQTRMRDAG